MISDLISLADLKGDEILALLERADEMKAMQRAGKAYQPLKGLTAAMIFEKPSLRTRVTFETGMFQLGGHAVHLESLQIRLGERGVRAGCRAQFGSLGGWHHRADLCPSNRRGLGRLHQGAGDKRPDG